MDNFNHVAALRSEYITALVTENWAVANRIEREADAKPFGEAAAAIKNINAADYLPHDPDCGQSQDLGETDYGGDR